MDQSVEIGERTVYYAKVGHGPHTILLMPASLSTTWLQFKRQIEAFSRDKFSIIAWNPLGYGRSKSAAMECTSNYFEDLADYAYEFMKVLHIPKYSLLGWCGGGRACFILAGKHPEVVIKMVVICANAFITQTEFDNYARRKDINTWKARLRVTILVYGKEAVSKYWSDFLNVITQVWETKNGDICTGYLKKIKCPTLIVLGGKDPGVHEFHGEFLMKHIEDCRLHVYPDGYHNVHITHSSDFNPRAEAFLLE